MASKRYCDRCGKEIVRAEKGWLKRYIYFGEFWFEPSMEYDAQAYDLCPECVKSFQAWMKNGEKGEE